MGAVIHNVGYRSLAVKSAGVIDTVKPGDKLTLDRDLSDKEVADLTLAGAVVSGTSKPNERAVRYAALIEGLTNADITKAGKPEVDALNALLDDDEVKFTATERDELFDAQ